MIQLDEIQRQELLAPEPTVIDPHTQEAYVLVRRSTYERLKHLIAADDFNPDDAGGFINEIMADDDTKDPWLESYQAYGKPA